MEAVWLYDSYSLQFVSDWFVTQGQIKIWDDDNDHYEDDEIIEWCNGHKKWNAKKAKIKKS